ncbi:YnbE family lipoprotein [Brevundimonas sp. 2R-24]|uniref:YnbE family lipoprotein n=1 Tax=Peiella sedimenti TaxID=3061083 RepID=A0ABT8SLF5_9CAUL|nr:YnbE family lipoprotein [Caulobacteraceae bacterium XZ-24]
MKRPDIAIALVMGAVTVGAACTPTVRVKVDPISIYAKLDADVRIRLDEEVRALIQQNPELF